MNEVDKVKKVGELRLRLHDLAARSTCWSLHVPLYRVSCAVQRKLCQVYFTETVAVQRKLCRRGCAVQRKLCRRLVPPAVRSTLRQAGDDGILDAAHADAFQDLKVTLVAPLAPETVGHQPVPGRRW